MGTGGIGKTVFACPRCVCSIWEHSLASKEDRQVSFNRQTHCIERQARNFTTESQRAK